MKSIYKKILSIGLLSAVFELMSTRQAHAFDLIDIASGTVGFIAQVILGIFTFVAQGFFAVAGFFVELAMKLNDTILDPTQNVFLFKGWTVFVNVADLALVVGLIIIAFATMLNSETYGMKKALWKLIVVALLVNFSLVIPGVLVDLAGMVTAFFVEQAGLNGSSMSSSLATAFNISGFLSTKELPAGASADAVVGAAAATMGAGLMNILMNMVFILVFTIVATVILLTLAAMLFLRYFMLSFLLLMTPIIFVSWIFPGTKSHWDKWWNDFIRWTMFPPVMVFFMWLALTALNSTTAVESTSTGSAGDLAKSIMNFNISALIHMAMAVMLMILSLIAANSISIKGAKGGKDAIGTMTNWGQGKLNGMGKSSAAYGRREGERLGRRAGTPVTAAIGRRAEAFRKYEGEKGGALGFAAGKLGRAGERVSSNQQAALKKTYDDKFKGMSDANVALRYSTMGADEKVFAAQQLAAKGNLSKVNEQMLDRDISAKGAKEAFDKFGGDGAYDKMVKAAGRNAEMIDAKAKQPELDAKIREVEEREVVAKKETNPTVRSAQLAGLKKEKDDLEKGGYREVAKKFYETFDRKNFEALGSKFYSEGKYGDEALKGLMLKEPGAFGKIIAGLDKREDVEKFNAKAVGIIESMKKESLEVVKNAHGSKIESETNKELLAVMKEMKDFNQTDAEGKNLRDKLKWIEERDERAHAKMGGAELADSLEQQVRFLQSKKNPELIGIGDEMLSYRKAIDTEKSLHRSMGKRLYAESEEKEKKEA